MSRIQNRNTGGLSQLSTQMRYQFISATAPVGVTLSLELQLSGFFDQDTRVSGARRTALEAVLTP